MIESAADPRPRFRNAAVFSRGILRIPHLTSFLPEIEQITWRHPLGGDNYDAVLGWGYKSTASRARSFAKKANLPYLALEDGFIRSIEIGCVGAPPLSIIIDEIGTYYDATAPSRLENLLAKGGWETPELLSRAHGAMEFILRERISKYNHAPVLQRPLPGECPQKVLVIDQTLNDASVSCGLADAQTFADMLRAALEENPEADVIIKTHPDVLAGKKRGWFPPPEQLPSRVHLLAEDLNPLSVLESVDRVYVVTSQMGFEALLLGKPVDCFGMPFYAGWGLTHDRQVCPRRTRQRTIEELFAAAYLLYPRYLDPETGLRCEIERVLEWMALQRRMRERFPTHVYALGFSIYKRPIVRSFLQGSAVRFLRKGSQVPAGATVAVWGRKPVAGELADGARTLRLEDGFLRSVGLGADLIRPLSWVMDGRGIYYDATRPSDLEHLLQTTAFDETLLARARALREQLVAGGLTKYNVGAKGWRAPSPAGEAQQRLVLVPGQVESDASLAYGASGLRRNLDLLRAVWEANPQAYIVYKPHPDVVAGLRRQGEGEESAERWCDEVVVDVSMGELLPQVDEVHTLTSLAGFEALLRGKRVVCYGQPFYAGWGLTEDQMPVPRRLRRLALDELVAGTLILYPTYVSRTTGRFTTAERALEELLQWRSSGPGTLPWWRRPLRWLLRGVKPNS